MVVSQRLARALLAILVGASLGCSGLLTQTTLRNPLASPDILGVNHGAALAAVFILTRCPNLPITYLPWACLTGALMASIALKLFIGKRFTPLFIAVSGIALSAWLAAINEYLLLSRSQSTSDALLWLTGSLWGRGWPQLQWGVISLILLPLPLFLSQPLNILLLGESSALSLGIHTHRIRQLAILLSIVLTAICVALCGPLGFIGLIAPHIARQISGGLHQLLLPVAMLSGALLLLLADLIGRMILSPIEIPAGIVTALLGAPYFLMLIVKQERSSC
ncbi:MAG: Fe(3+) dicitrate transport system permease protein FecD [Candidatus Celerinatantimonas neptuna]|nr:MAG: Fe(3+) dicitrate transport system permease protein FecD [Candidatus Celerinatantimonas neptuna]